MRLRLHKEAAQHRSPSLNECICTIKVIKQLKGISSHKLPQLVYQSWQINASISGQARIACDSGRLPGGVSQEFLLLCCHPIHGPPVTLFASRTAGEGVPGHKAVNIGQPVGCGQVMNCNVYHTAISHPGALFQVS